MDTEKIQQALDELKKQPKRKFSQSYDFIINLKNLIIKQNPIDLFVTLHYNKGKKVKVAAFVDQQLLEQANEFCDLTIPEKDFDKYKDVKVLKKLAEEYDYFIAQSTLMPKIAAAFGKVLGSKGKMPNPKLGSVVLPNANLEPLVKKLNTTVRLSAKKGLNLQCIVGKEGQPDNEIIDNINTAYQAVLKQLPNEMQNIKSIMLKLTMGKPVRL
ncbi:MAG: 50S ribosomal protein L1 [Nanoarchaeota archaeon]|nr:50S ribosomal protein L1 [Nanoarchaeota archaeon]MBU1643684.1 50S ribosomal protein L1 [Nanoarchaeota archaeon]MBU1976710.1 50S ribosomal protein L1 [Nanoarchaeota archaeon]